MGWDPLAAAPVDRRFVWVGLAVFVALLQAPEFLDDLRPEPTQGVDFFQDWASARNYLNGRPIYEDLGRAIRDYLELPGDVVVYIPVNAHPPSSVLLCLPFASLAYPDAVLAWNICSLTMFAGALWLIVRDLELPFQWWSVAPLVVLLLVAYPFRQQMLQGQWNLLLLLLLTGVWHFERTGRPTWAGALLGLATAIKIHPAVLFLYYVARRQWTTLWAGAATVALVTAMTCALVGIDTFRQYAFSVLPSIESQYGSLHNVSVMGFWGRLFDPEIKAHQVRIRPVFESRLVAKLAGYLSCIAVAIVMCRCTYQARERENADVAHSLAIACMLLVSPVSWEHYLLLLLLPLLLLWQRMPDTPGWKFGFGCALVAMMTPQPSVLDTESTWFQPQDSLTRIALPFYGLLVTFLLCARLIRIQTPPGAERSLG